MKKRRRIDASTDDQQQKSAVETIKKRRRKLKKKEKIRDEEDIEEVHFGAQLAHLAAKDPEFIAYLREEEPDLFEANEDEEAGEEQMEQDRQVNNSTDDEGALTDADNEINPAEEEKEQQKKMVLSSGTLSVQLRKEPTSGRLLVSAQLVHFLDQVLRADPQEHSGIMPSAVRTAVNAFVACVARVGGGFVKLGGSGQLDFVVRDERVFDGIIRLCFQCLGRCLYRLLKPIERKPSLKHRHQQKKDSKKNHNKQRRQKQSSKHTHFKHWHRYGALTKHYLTAMNIFVVELQSNQVIVPAIRAVTDLVDLYLHFPKLCKELIKFLVRVWSRRSEEARCIAFVALCKIARLDPEYFSLIYKSCYVAYIANCKLIDEETLPFIEFMQRSFVELTFLHPGMAYQYAFVYIRQFAIHLRNAMIAKRKDLIQTVHNWQFLKGLQLWARVIVEGSKRFPATCPLPLSASAGVEGHTKRERESSSQQNTNSSSSSTTNNSWFRELAHPLVEIVSIEHRLVFPSPKYLPLRIHCLRMLLAVQASCQMFIPVLAYAIELLVELAQMDEKRPQAGKGTTKGAHLDKMLRLSREQLEDAGVRQHLAQQLFGLASDALEQLLTPATGTDHDDKMAAKQRQRYLLLVPIATKLRHFLKSCKNREHVRLFTRLKTMLHAVQDDE